VRRSARLECAIRIDVYLEVGRRRVFAGALDWPGWCRSGRDADAAGQALIAYGPRYAAAIGRAGRGFKPPRDVSALEVVERIEGNATTDFGAPGVAPVSDARPLEDAEAERLATLLQACWATLDRAAGAASGAVLRKGPRGGGRELDAIVRHVLEADKAYLSRLGRRYRKTGDADVTAELAGVRGAFLEAFSARVHGGPLAPSRRSTAVWTPRYAVRRSAWHVLDHAWEIEDRATTGPTRRA
jgi:hypothetical protein